MDKSWISCAKQTTRIIHLWKHKTKAMQNFTIDELQTIRGLITRELNAWKNIQRETEIDNNQEETHLIVNAYFCKANTQYLQRIQYKLEQQILKH